MKRFKKSWYVYIPRDAGELESVSSISFFQARLLARLVKSIHSIQFTGGGAELELVIELTRS